MNVAVAVLGAFATLVAAGAAIGAWKAAAILATIERHRWHADLTPRFEVTCTASSGDRAKLKVALVGPPGLDRLDRVTVTIRDDIRGREPVTAGGPTAEQIAGQVWGPYRLVRGVDGADETGRRATPVELLLGDWRPFALERTLPPTWSNDTDGWRQQYADQPVRLALVCERQGHEPWTVPIEVPVGRDAHPDA